MRASYVFIAMVLALGLLAIPAGYIHSYFTDMEASTSQLTAWKSALWSQTTQSNFNAGVLYGVDTNSSPGNVTIDKIMSPVLYAMSGDGSSSFYRYYISNNSWSALNNTPDSVSGGGSLAFDNNYFVYALGGDLTHNFWRYNTSNNVWTSMNSTPDKVNWGGALTYTGGNYIYALAGNNSSFWRYNISGDSWTTMSSIPNAIKVKEGGAMVYAGGNYIYAATGNGTKTFLRYNISNDSWDFMQTISFQMTSGGALVYTGGDYIYAFPGGNSQNFLRYSISANSWTIMTGSIPGPQQEGAALAYDGTYIYAFEGHLLNKFWRYNISDDTWNDTVVSDLPSGRVVGWGGSLAYTPGGYASSGTIASQVLTTNSTRSRWDCLFWTSVCPANTSITFQVRASDTLFAKDSSVPSWITVGSTSPVPSGLPSGKYMQWHATMNTNNFTITPILQDVGVYYTDF